MSVPITATVLHYGLTCYEGMNVVKNIETGKLQSFRADEALLQFLDSTNHLDMPLFDTRELYYCLKKLVETDISWFPESSVDRLGQMYVRAAHVSMDPIMGVASPRNTRIFAVLAPTRLQSTPKELSLKCSDSHNKNWPLGHGQYTLGGNLGPLMPVIEDAKKNGFDDVLWLLDDYVQEMTVLNTFFVLINRYNQLELVTPPDNGCILANTIRNSILQLKT